MDMCQRYLNPGDVGDVMQLHSSAAQSFTGRSVTEFVAGALYLASSGGTCCLQLWLAMLYSVQIHQMFAVK